MPMNAPMIRSGITIHSAVFSAVFPPPRRRSYRPFRSGGPYS